MGWNDHDPAFSAIEAKAEELMDEGLSHDAAWERATSWYSTREIDLDGDY